MVDQNKRNKNVWRKVVGYGPQPSPVISSFYDIRAEQSYSLNLQSTVRHRDFFEVEKSPTTRYIPYGEYDEGLIFFDFDDITEKTFNFNFEFSSMPVVVLSVDEDTNFSNINAYGITYSTTGAYIGISAPYSGNIRYRAVYAVKYPCYVKSAYTTSYFTASAGRTTVSNATGYQSMFGFLPDLPSEKHETAWDPVDNTSNIYIDNEILTIDTISSSLSDVYSKEIHFIVSTNGLYGFAYEFGFNFGD